MDYTVQKIKSFFFNRETRNKILFTLFIILVFRFMAAVTLPGVDVSQLANITNNNPLSTIFSLSTGGKIDSPSLVAIGLGSYISASIIVQLLQSVLPKLEELSKEGQRGRMILNQITRYLTVPLTIVQALVILTLFKSGQFGNLFYDASHFETTVAFVAALTAGTMFLMWMAEAITESGIGQGSTMIILVGILSSLFPVVGSTYNMFMEQSQASSLVFFILALFVLLMIVVLVSEAVRKITIQYSNRVRSIDNSLESVAPAEKSFFPVKPNIAGVMPVIFASALVSLPNYIATYFMTTLADQPGRKLYIISEWLTKNIYANNAVYNYLMIEVVLILLFTFMYTFSVFKPAEVSENLKKSGAFIPGIRPGKNTTDYISSVVLRMTVVGAIFLVIVAIAPTLFIQASGGLKIDLFSVIGGTSLLIIVTGLLEVFRQLDALLLNRSYDKYIGTY